MTRPPGRRGNAGRSPRMPGSSKSGGRGGKATGGGGGKGCTLILIALASVPTSLWWLVTR